jgi:hypothetical protein
MLRKAWQRIALAILPIAVCLAIVQHDRSATAGSGRDPFSSGGSGEPIAGSTVAVYSTSGTLQELAANLPAVESRVQPALPLPKARSKPVPQAAALDSTVQSQVGPAAMPGLIRSFDGVANADNPSQFVPPDSTGDVGPNHYFQSVNVSFAIYNKAGAKLIGPFPNNAIWQSPNIDDQEPCKTTNSGTPTVLYDHLADRWILSQPAWPNINSGQGPYHQCFAISQTGDPLGSYWLYSFKLSDTELNDYPKLGVWPDGYYMSVNQFAFNNDTNQYEWSYPAVYAFERAEMLRGRASNWIGWNYHADVSWGGMLPSDLDGPAPPAGTPNYFVEVDDGQFVPPDDALHLWEAHADWDNLILTFGVNGVPNAALPTASFNLLACSSVGTRECIPQKDTSQKVDAMDDRLMQRLQYRNFGDHQSLVANHTVNAGGGRAGVRWYEIRDPGGRPSIHQQGTYAPLGAHRWMGSAAMDRQGNLAVGYSISSTSMFPSIAYAGRLISDPSGTFGQGEATLMAGGGSQLSQLARWGGYTMMAVDPTDDCTFWYTNQYYSVTSQQLWRTRIGSFRFPSCTGAPTGHLFGTVTRAGNNAPLANATVRAGTRTVVTNAAGVYQLFNLPVGSYNLSVSAPGYAARTINGVAVSDRRTTTQNVSLQVSSAPTPVKGFLPVMVRSLSPTATPTPTKTPPAPPKCDAFEPNDSRSTNPAGPLLSGQNYQAKLCAGDPEDNYFFTTATGNQIQISITLPPGLVNRTLLWVYDQDDLRQGQEVCKPGYITKSPTTVLCSIQNPGTYVMRLYTDSEAVFDDVNPYTFKVDFQ